MSDKKAPAPGDGIRSLKSTTLFRVVNYELYARPNIVMMGLGLVAFTGCLGYITYMRSQYDAMGYYPVVKEDGTEEFVKRKSKWD